MNLLRSYKQTEVGLIPDDWSVSAISSIVTDFRGGAPLKPSDFTSIGVKVLPKGGVGRTGKLRIAENDLQFCSPHYANTHPRNQVDRSYTIVVLRDLVPSGPSIGLIVEIDTDECFVLAQGVYGFKVNREYADARYLIQLSNTAWYRNLANSIMVGSTQVHITNTAFKKVEIPLPALPEQHAIATALSDVDKLLAAQDKLIAKKRDIKQAAMQQLLTGKERLPGFTGEREVKRLGDVAMIYQPVTISAGDLKSDGFTVYGANGIIGKYDKFNHETWQTIVTCRGSTCGTVNRTEENSWITGNAMVMNVDENKSINKLFFYHLLKAQDFSLCITGSGQPQIVRGPLFEFVVNLPPNLEEQTAIATTLSDMDADLTALEQQRDKTRSIKQGMMQELLTGRIRLV